MAHRFYLSPDRQWVLVVEMDGGWRPCRLAPFEGGGGWSLTGPVHDGRLVAGWKVDVFLHQHRGHRRRRDYVLSGRPVLCIVTSVGARQSTLWVHDARGERQITSEGYASLPQFSADGKRLYITPPCVSWSPGGKFIYFNLRFASQMCVVPLAPGRSLPPLPSGGIGSVENAARLPGARMIPEERAYAGPNPSVYAFVRIATHRNIYRIPVP
jgi:hypothetical protein